MSKPKALIVASVASMIRQFNLPYITKLQELGFDVEVACNFIDGGNIPSAKSQELINWLEKNSVKLHQVDFSRKIYDVKSNFISYFQLKKIMKNGYSLVHSHTPVGGALARLSAIKYRKNGLKSVYTAHGFHFYNNSSKIMWLTIYPIEKLLSRYTDLLFTINKEDYNTALDRKFHAKKISHLSGVGIDLKKFCNDSESNNKTITHDNIKIDGFILTYVAELNKNKNQEMLISILSNLRYKIPNVRLLLVGVGENYHEYQRKIEELDLCDHIFLLGYRDDVNSILKNTDIYVASSKREGLPLNIIEAMASNLPIVATNVRGHNDLINSENGVLIDDFDYNEFEHNIISLYRNEALRIKLSRNVALKISDYSIEKILEDYKNEILEIFNN